MISSLNHCRVVTKVDNCQLLHSLHLHLSPLHLYLSPPLLLLLLKPQRGTASSAKPFNNPYPLIPLSFKHLYAAPYRFQRIIRYHVYNLSGFPDSIFQVRCSSGISNHERLVLNIYQGIHHIIRFLDMCNPYPVSCMVILHFSYG